MAFVATLASESKQHEARETETLIPKIEETKSHLIRKDRKLVLNKRVLVSKC